MDQGVAGRQKIQPLIDKVVCIIRMHFGQDCRIYLYGSWAKGNASETSDLDIAIDAGVSLGSEEMSMLQGHIGGIHTLRKIEVVDLNAIGADFREEIIRTGELLK